MQYRGRVKGKVASNAYVVAVVGIGGRMDESYQHASPGDCLRDEALAGSAAGDACAHYSDIEGGTFSMGPKAGLIAIGWEDLRRVPMGIGVAGGPGRVLEILGAVRVGPTNALVTDEKTATGCLMLSEAA
jgi:deoxyribonucleoside regulator